MNLSSSVRPVCRLSVAPYLAAVAGRLCPSRSLSLLGRKASKSKVIVLGTGWGSMEFFRNVNTDKYDVAIVSPKNYFTFTPLLPSVCSGTLTPFACIEPVRTFLWSRGKRRGHFYEASCERIDPETKSIVCRAPGDKMFKLPFDYLVMAVGAEANTFGIEGVEENAFFLKEVEHAQAIRRRVMRNFEIAALPVISEEDKKRLLHFVVVGGGPTGCETAAEFADYLQEDMRRYFPDLVDLHAKVTLIEMTDRVLPTFPSNFSDFARNVLANKCDCSVLLSSAVTKIVAAPIASCLPSTLSDGKGTSCPSYYSVSVTNKDPKASAELPKDHTLECGLVLWASGIGQVPLSKTLMEELPEQANSRVLKTNEKLMIKGLEGKGMYALGDCSWLEPPKLVDRADEFYSQAKKESKKGNVRGEWIKKSAKKLQIRYPQLAPLKLKESEMPLKDSMNVDEFRAVLEKIDKNYRPPAPTAQNARQAGAYMAKVFNKYPTVEQKDAAPAFCEKWKGSMAYLGAGQSVAYTPWFNVLGGRHSTIFWKLVYAQMQLTWRSRAICLFDWFRTQFIGRDVGRDHTSV